LIDRIRLWGPISCCRGDMAGFQVYVSNSSSLEELGRPCYNPHGDIVGAVTLTTAGSHCFQGRFIHVTAPAMDSKLHICKVEVFRRSPYTWRAYEGVRLVSQGMVTMQSSTEAGHESGLAVDGRLSNNGGVHTCASTVPNQWAPNQGAIWTVDLGQSQDVRYVDVWVRTDCCIGRNTRLEVYVGESTVAMENSRCPEVPNTISPAGLAGSVRLPCVATGRYVHIRRGFVYGDDNVLTLCGMYPIGHAAVTSIMSGLY
jgi:hypothetical protein